MADLEALKKELDKIKAELSSVRVSVSQTGRSDRPRDLSLQTLIRPWGGGILEEPVETFLTNFSLVANNGGWTEAEQLMICRLKLTGAAANCIAGHPELLEATATFTDLEAILKQRFTGTATPEELLLALNSVEQLPEEDAQQFADRCRKLGEER